jgi:hypothetical protein
MAKQITVKTLREQLERLEQAGLGEAQLWFRDWDDIDHKIEEGVFDACERNGVKNIVLG